MLATVLKAVLAKRAGIELKQPAVPETWTGHVLQYVGTPTFGTLAAMGLGYGIARVNGRPSSEALKTALICGDDVESSMAAAWGAIGDASHEFVADVALDVVKDVAVDLIVDAVKS